MTDDIAREYRKQQSLAYCKHVGGLAYRMECAKMNYEMARDALDGLKAYRFDVTGGTERDGQPVEVAIELLHDAGDRMVQAINEWAGECEQFDNICRRMSPLSSYVLTMHYRNGMKWDDVAKECEKASHYYTVQYLRDDLRERALNEMYDLLPPIRK